jgi:hypothetical protein
VPSNSLIDWRTTGFGRLTELENVRASVTPSGPGRKWGTNQWNRSLTVALVAQFQKFCRELHDEAVAVHVSVASPNQGLLLRTLLTQGRKLDTMNPRSSALGADFGRLGFSFIDDLKACGQTTEIQLKRLDTFIDYRNAIGHGNEATITSLEASGQLSATKASFVAHRRLLSALAGTVVTSVANKLASLLGIPRPW